MADLNEESEVVPGLPPPATLRPGTTLERIGRDPRESLHRPRSSLLSRSSYFLMERSSTSKTNMPAGNPSLPL